MNYKDFKRQIKQMNTLRRVLENIDTSKEVYNRNNFRNEKATLLLGLNKAIANILVNEILNEWDIERFIVLENNEIIHDTQEFLVDIKEFFKMCKRNNINY